MTKEIILNTKKDLAKYYMEREFSNFDFSLMQEMEKKDMGYISPQSPSDEYYLKDFLDNNKEYKKKIKELEDLEEDGNEDIKEEFETYKDEDENYPMWNTVWKIDAGWKVEIFEKGIDKLAEIGIGLLEFKKEYYLFITGCGYDFYEAHWIPLFTKFFNWIDEDCGKEFETITICKNEHAVYTGSEELQALLSSSITTDYGTTKTQGYINYSLVDLKDIVDIYENPYREELDLLIKEMEENDFENLRIE